MQILYKFFFVRPKKLKKNFYKDIEKVVIKIIASKKKEKKSKKSSK